MSEQANAARMVTTGVLDPYAFRDATAGALLKRLRLAIQYKREDSDHFDAEGFVDTLADLRTQYPAQAETIEDIFAELAVTRQIGRRYLPGEAVREMSRRLLFAIEGTADGAGVETLEQTSAAAVA